jgi:hypothetical protein
MWVMYDSTDVGQIPPGAQAVAGYVGGRWPTYRQLLARFPHAQHHLSIAINAQVDADCLDVENGDATPSDCSGWYRRQRARGLARPAFYGSLSTIPAITRFLSSAGIARHEYRIWSAHYTGQAHICDARCGLKPAADGTQWADRVGSRNCDLSLLSDTFFGARPNPLTPTEQLVVMHIRRLRQEIFDAAEHGRLPDGRPTQRGWRFHNRAERYQLLRHP